MDVESRLKTALDESRLLILGAQVLFGFQFEAVFQERFPDISDTARHMHGAGLVLMLISISLLIAPSLFHQIVFAGDSRPGAIATATTLAGISLLPLTVGLGISAFVALEHVFGRSFAIAAGSSFTATGLALLYGLGFALRRDQKNQMQENVEQDPAEIQDRANADGGPGHHPGRPGAARISIDCHVDEGVQRTAGPVQICSWCRAMCGGAGRHPSDDARSASPPWLSG
jgi:Family of unknown function (DUF6328)